MELVFRIVAVPFAAGKIQHGHVSIAGRVPFLRIARLRLTALRPFTLLLLFQVLQRTEQSLQIFVGHFFLRGVARRFFTVAPGGGCLLCTPL